MNNILIKTTSYFDGHIHHRNGPYWINIKAGVIRSIQQQAPSIQVPNLDSPEVTYLETEFIMPSFVEAHCHLFLDGGELDFNARRNYLCAQQNEMELVAQHNISASLKSGITLIRDAGDRYGINHAVREKHSIQPSVEFNQNITIRSPGIALRQHKRYGSFMAKEVSTKEEIQQAINKIAQQADDLKILVSGIIDFEAGAVTQQPQFDLNTLRYIVQLAAEKKLKTFAHCSGIDSLKIAVEAGVNSIEHGYFMEESILDIMVEKNIAWVPTFSPVYFQWKNPELAGWKNKTIDNLKRILDKHLQQVYIAYKKGVPLIAGSDAGSYGVAHGSSLIDELFFFLDAGLPMDEVLKSATSRPRFLWNCESSDIKENNYADLIILGSSPYDTPTALYDVQQVINTRPLIHV